jgi:translocation and assembly module TamB
VLLAGLVAWLVGTEAGLRFLVSTGVSRSPVPITIERVEGRLWGALRLGGIEVRQDGTRLRLETLALRWRPGELLARRVHVRSLVLEGIHLTLAPPEPKADTAGAPPAELPEIDLPVVVQLDTVRLRAITLRQAGRTDSVAIREVALDGLEYGDSLGVQRFALATPWGELAFRGWVRTQGEYPLDISFQWNLAPPDLPRVIAYGAVTGDLDTLTIRQNITAPARLFSQIRLEELTRRFHFEASARLEPLDLTTVVAKAPRATVAAEFEARGDAERQVTSLTASLASKDYGTWDLSARATAGPEVVELTSLRLDQRQSEALLTASGTVSMDSALASLDALAEWSALAWPPLGKPLVTLPRGQLAFRGDPANWKVELQSEVRSPRGVEESLRAGGHGDTTSFVLEKLTGSFLGGTLQAAGRFTWGPGITWDVNAAARDFDTSVLAPDWPSRIGARLSTAGSWQDSTWAARLDLDEVAGEVRGRPLSGRLHFSGRSDTASSVDAEMRYAGASLVASGPVLAPMAVEWRVDVPSLADLDPGLSGRLEGSGLVEGADTLARATARLAARALEVAGASVGDLSLDALFDRTRSDAVELTCRARDVALPPLAPIDSLRAALRGARDGYAFAVALESPLRRLALEGSASGSDTVWTGQLTRLDLAVSENTPWRLAEPVPFEASPSRGRFGPLALRASPAALDARADWEVGGDATVEASFSGFPLANANAVLPAEYRLRGTAAGTSRATLGADGVLDAECDLGPMDGSVTWHADRVLEIPFQRMRVSLRSSAEALRLEGGIELPELGELAAELRLPGFRWNRFDSTQAVQGEVRAQASRWSLVEAVAPEVRKLQGALDARVNLAGTIGAPSLAGEVRFEAGALDLPAYGLEIRDLHLTASGDGRGQWNLESGLRSLPGSLAMRAEADLSDARRPRASARVSGESFEVVDIAEARVLVSPDLELKLDGTRLDLAGEVSVPSARIDAGSKMLELPTPRSPDIVVVREQPDTTALPLELHTRVRLTLGDDVSLKGYGLKAEPEGGLVVMQEPNKPALGQGELSLRSGTYTGYGRDLTIERGRLIYAGGPVDDPEVDIRASREIERDDVVVGFEVTGTLKQSQLTVFSDPEMSQSDAISYLLFNRPIAEAKSSESAIARQTAAAMGLQAGSAYTQKLASKVGLQEATLESEGTLREASLMLGTYLTPSLYARYGIGLFDSANTFQLSYFLSKHWTLEAETSEQNRAGIIYSIEP